MAETIVSTRKRTSGENALLEEFRKEIVKQNDRLDDLAKELFKVELAISGVYVTVLKLLPVGTAPSGWKVWVTFIVWFIALIFTWVALFPKQYRVMEDVLDRSDSQVSDKGEMTIKEFYTESANWKRGWLRLATLFFFLGVFSAVAIL